MTSTLQHRFTLVVPSSTHRVDASIAKGRDDPCDVQNFGFLQSQCTRCGKAEQRVHVFHTAGKTGAVFASCKQPGQYHLNWHGILEHGCGTIALSSHAFDSGSGVSKPGGIGCKRVGLTLFSLLFACLVVCSNLFSPRCEQCVSQKRCGSLLYVCFCRFFSRLFLSVQHPPILTRT